MSASRGVLERLSGRRMWLVVAVATIVVAAAIAIYVVISPREEVLFANLRPDDAAALAAELERIGASYRIGGEGDQILVEEKDVNGLRMRLMESGVTVNATVGFELFDKSDFGVTEFAQKIGYQRALQGELARTIGALKEVRAARVHLVLPENALFGKTKQRATASVTLFVRDDHRLTAERIAGIQRLVASSVPMLHVDDVSVTDHHGAVLNKKTGGEIRTASELLAAKIEVERYLQDKVRTLLHGAFEELDISVSVDATIDPERVKSVREVAAGPVDGMFPIVKKRESRSGKKDASRNETISLEVEYGIGKDIEEMTRIAGSVKRVSVGVLIAGDMNDEDASKVREIVGMAIGFDKERGDSIAVHTIGDWKGEVTGETEGTDSSMTMGRLESNGENDALPMRTISDGYWNLAVVLFVMLAGALIFLALAIDRRSRRENERRERVLAELKAWIDADHKREEFVGE